MVIAALAIRLVAGRKITAVWEVRLLYVGVGWGTLVCFAILMWWDNNTRFVIAGIALITVAVLPLIYERRALRYAVAYPLASITLLAAWYSVLHVEGRSFKTTWAALVTGAPTEQVLAAGKVEQATALLRDNFPAESRIGLISGGTTPWFLLIRTLPQLRFESVRAETSFERLQKGSLAAVLIDESLHARRGGPLERILMFPVGDDPSLVLPGLLSSFGSLRLFVRNPGDFFAKNLSRYGLSLVSSGGDETLLIENLRALMDLPRHWHYELAFSVPRGTSDRLIILPLVVSPLTGWEAGQIVCVEPRRRHVYYGSARLTSSALLLRIPGGDTATTEVFHSCTWRPKTVRPLLMQLDPGNSVIRDLARAHNFMLLGAPGLLLSLRKADGWPADEEIRNVVTCLLASTAEQRCHPVEFSHQGTADK